jgi:hypothetical protein
MRNTTFLLLLLSTPASVLAQGGITGCLTHELTLRHLAAQGWTGTLHEAMPTFAGPEGMAKAGGGPVIPVVVHVVWNTTAENIPDAQVQAIIQQMDQDFNLENANAANVRPAFQSSIADAGIRFCLAQTDPLGQPTNGITRTYTTATWFNPNTQPHDMKAPPLGRSPWDPTRYLNIWVCDINGTSSNIVNGYTYLPTGGMAGSLVDGLVIDYLHGMTLSSRTATHEAGHYFGLRHTFDGYSCFSDDGIADTPNTDSPTWNCFNPNLMKCGVLTQYENFLDYSGCTAMFTLQQAAYMNNVLNTTRASLLTATGCTGSGTAIAEAGHGVIGLQPNPAQGECWITAPEGITAELRLLDVAGRTLRRLPLQGARTRMDLGGLTPGRYTVLLLQGDVVMSRPLTVLP